MAFWQSPVWTAATSSIYPMEGRNSDPEFLPWWREAWELFRRRAQFDVVVTMGARESLAYGILCAIAGVESKQIFTEVFIDDPKPQSLAWRIKSAAFRLVARRAIGMLTNSTAEVETNEARFGISRERIRFVQMHSNIPAEKISALDDGFILSAGRSLRDYTTLLAAARKIARQFVIICGSDDLRDAEIPGNVELLREIPRQIYLEKLRRCSMVVVPLRQSGRATGQVVVFEAMSCGKPVVATRAPGTIDIIRDGENGLLVPPADPAAMTSAITGLLAREDFARELATRAHEDIVRLHTFDAHATAKLQAIAQLHSQARSASQ